MAAGAAGARDGARRPRRHLPARAAASPLCSAIRSRRSSAPACRRVPSPTASATTGGRSSRRRRTGLGTTFTPSIIGFASTLDALSRVLDARYPPAALMWLLAAYLALLDVPERRHRRSLRAAAADPRARLLQRLRPPVLPARAAGGPRRPRLLGALPLPAPVAVPRSAIATSRAASASSASTLLWRRSSTCSSASRC